MNDHRTEPRRRGDQLVEAIHDAVLAELAENGYAAVTMDTVAQRARTGKASLYRRWPTKIELIMDVIYSRLPTEVAQVDTGSLRTDLITVFDRIQSEFTGPAGGALRGLWAESLADEDQWERVRSYARGDSVALMRTIIDRAVERGEIDRASVTRQRLEAGPAILRFQLLWNNRPLDVTGLVDEVVLPLLTAS